MQNAKMQRHNANAKIQIYLRQMLIKRVFYYWKPLLIEIYTQKRDLKVFIFFDLLQPILTQVNKSPALPQVKTTSKNVLIE